MTQQTDDHGHPKGPILGRDIRFNEDAYPFWKEHFDQEARDAMVKEDLQAGEFVSAELFIIVFVGVLLGLCGVLASLY